MSMALPRPSAHDALHLFRSANVVVGLSHGRCGVAGLRSGNYVILGCYGLPTNLVSKYVGWICLDVVNVAA